MSQLKNFRVLKNLGSRILDVKPYVDSERAGYQVIYSDGDDCLDGSGRRYQSHVKYECDPEGDKRLNDFPKLITYGDY